MWAWVVWVSMLVSAPMSALELIKFCWVVKGNSFTKICVCCFLSNADLSLISKDKIVHYIQNVTSKNFAIGEVQILGPSF